MGILSFLINDVITQAPIFLGLVALIGLLLQKKDAAEVFTGTIKTITGTVVLLAGVDLFLGVLLPLMALLQEKGNFTGVMPDNQAPFGVVMTSFAKEIPIAFVLGFLIHLLLVRVLPFKNTKNVFLTGHIMLFLSGFWVAILAWNFGLKRKRSNSSR
ncbi:PTS transporter subunit IIC [Enterococcus avium]|uniref:PTS transporter subunit IIC n=1 Tax=Enterococcus avium TaxID=33945 RepID=UPI002159E66E|nr:PTS transporter subunit IIC [Enterococcus avium]